MTWIGSGVAKHGDWFVVNFAAEWVLPYIFAGPTDCLRLHPSPLPDLTSLSSIRLGIHMGSSLN